MDNYTVKQQCLTCCLPIMGRIMSAICRDSLFHLSSFSLWHCCRTRINISNTYTHTHTHQCFHKNTVQRIIAVHNADTQVQCYLVMLYKAQQHGHNHLFLSLQLFTCISFIGASQHKKIMHYGLQGGDCWEAMQTQFKTIHSSYLTVLSIKHPALSSSMI